MVSMQNQTLALIFVMCSLLFIGGHADCIDDDGRLVAAGEHIQKGLACWKCEANGVLRTSFPLCNMLSAKQLRQKRGIPLSFRPPPKPTPFIRPVSTSRSRPGGYRPPARPQPKPKPSSWTDIANHAGSTIGDGIANGFNTGTPDDNSNQQPPPFDEIPDGIDFYADSFNDRLCHPFSPYNPEVVPCPDTSSGDYVMFFPIPPDFMLCHPVSPFNPDVVLCPR